MSLITGRFRVHLSGCVGIRGDGYDVVDTSTGTPVLVAWCDTMAGAERRAARLASHPESAPEDDGLVIVRRAQPGGAIGYEVIDEEDGHPLHFGNSARAALARVESERIARRVGTLPTPGEAHASLDAAMTGTFPHPDDCECRPGTYEDTDAGLGLTSDDPALGLAVELRLIAALLRRNRHRGLDPEGCEGLAVLLDRASESAEGLDRAMGMGG